MQTTQSPMHQYHRGVGCSQRRILHIPLWYEMQLNTYLSDTTVVWDEVTNLSILYNYGVVYNQRPINGMGCSNKNLSITHHCYAAYSQAVDE